jgi:hypothetical protein
MNASSIDPKLVAWARRKLRERGLDQNDPVTWMIEYQEGKRDDRASETVTRGMCGDPFDALWEAELMADVVGGAPRGTGRWLMEIPGEEGTSPDYLVVVPHDDPDGGLPLTACLP